MKTTITNVMMVLNEAEFIEAAIRSVLPGVDQLIVIDQGSTDGTPDIMEKLGVTWVSTNGQNFETRGEQFFRQLAIDLCFSDWLMVSDGDEIFSDYWWLPVCQFIDSQASERYGAIGGRYWQMVGASEYCSLDSPLSPAVGERPLFFRKTEGLHAGAPMAGTKVHCPMEGIHPPAVAKLDFDVFHAGYMKSSLTDRFLRNINRGDWTRDETAKDRLRKSAQADPLSLLWPCMPLPLPRERLPASIRVPKFDVDYDPTTKRIVRRHAV